MLQAIQESIRDFIRDIGVMNPGEDQPPPPPDNDDDEFDWINLVYKWNIYREETTKKEIYVRKNIRINDEESK